MCIHTTAAYLVASRFAHGCMTKACKQRTQQHYRTPEAGTAGYKIHALGIASVYVVGLE